MPLALTAAGFLDHGVGAAAEARDFGAPSAGNSSSDLVSRVALAGLGAGGASGRLPAAFSDGGSTGVGAAAGSVVPAVDWALLGTPDGGGWIMSSSSTTSSMVGLWVCPSSAVCFSMSC